MFQGIRKFLKNLFAVEHDNNYGDIIDPIEVHGHPDQLNVAAYAIWALRDRGIDPYGRTNIGSMKELQRRLGEVVDIYSGMPINEDVKNEVKRLVILTINDMESQGFFSKW